ncbi:hypothetical protein D3C84_967640 [compost metagenome]
MVGHDDVDRAVFQTFNYSLHVARRTQRRVHFPVRIVYAWNIFIRQHQMVRAYFCSDVHTDRFRETNQADRLLRADVADVVMNARCFCQQCVAADVDRFGFIRNAFQTVFLREAAFRRPCAFN